MDHLKVAIYRVGLKPAQPEWIAVLSIMIATFGAVQKVVTGCRVKDNKNKLLT